MNGLRTLGLELDALDSLPRPKQAAYRAVAIGSSAVENVVRQEFSCDHVGTLRELVTLADTTLGVQSGLISVIQVCALNRAAISPRRQAGADNPLQYRLVQSLILTKGAAPRRYEIARDETGNPSITLEDTGLGTAQARTKLGYGTPYNIQFAPFDETRPPSQLIEARSQHEAPGLFIAATGHELVSSFTSASLGKLEAEIFAQATMLAEAQ